MPDRKIVFDEPDLWARNGGEMKFRLTYDGPLPSTQGAPRGQQPDPRGPAKHRMRQSFHAQLKRLWAINPNLADPRAFAGAIRSTNAPASPRPAALAEQFAYFGWNFVPLVTGSLDVTCGLDVLLLRPTPENKNSWFGDVDNRLKTLIDALQLPSANERYVDHRPEEDETPFFSLLENDKMLSRVAVETDEMLQSVGTLLNEGDVRLIITVEIRPLHVNMANLTFA